MNHPKSLFIENNPSAPFTLSQVDRSDSKSLYLLYMAAQDPMERTFAKEHIPGGYRSWLKLTESSFFKPYIDLWRKELDVLIKAQALQEIRTIASASEGPTRYQANKFLLEGSWNPHTSPKPTKPVGRPTTKDQAAIVSEAERLEQELIYEHSNRLKAFN